MLDFSPEVERLRPRIGDAAADALIVRERREVFSVQPEVRIAAWAGALLIAAAVGLFVKEQFELLDRRFVAVALGATAAGCYALGFRQKQTTVSTYIVLLGALILSADVAFIEQQFDLFGEAGHRHLLLLAILHGIAAYVFDSRLVLSLSIAALASWMGLERRDLLDFETGLTPRMLACAATLLLWRAADRRYRPKSKFSRVFEHFAAILALSGAHSYPQPATACIATVVVAAVVIWWGFRTRGESFVLYAFVYAVVAVDVWLFRRHTGDEPLIVLLSMLVAVPSLILIHRRFRRLAA